MDLKCGSKGFAVIAWQKFVGAKADGCFGKETEQLTIIFQKENNLRCDGRVGSNTLAVAREKGFVLPANPNAVETVLPISGVGFCGYNRERNGADQYGTAATIAAIINLGMKWDELHPECQLQIGDISRKGGGKFPPHASHKNGRDFDIRPFRRDNKMLPITCFDSAYDAKKTEEFVRLVRREYPNVTIFFNDSQFIKKGLTARAAGHHNHLHIRIK